VSATATALSSPRVKHNHIYRAMTPGQGGKSFKELCRDIAINQSGYTPKSGDERGFVNIHKGYSFDPLGNDDAIYSGREIYPRANNRYGYDNDGSDAAAEYVANRKGRKRRWRRSRRRCRSEISQGEPQRDLGWTRAETTMAGSGVEVR
jgi:hypothetical protein